MQTLDLDCPSCGETLELDAGFAGGVCRCSNCGTLMTVPRDAGRAEKLTSAPARSDSPNDEIDPDELEPVGRPGPARRGAGGTRGKAKRGKSKNKRGAARSETIDAGEYRTATGKIVTVEAPMRVPMAESKRKQVRVATTVVFMSVILCIAAVAVYAIITMVSGDGNTPANPNAAGGENNNKPAQLQYDPSINPYKADFPNIAGLPLKGDVAVVIEATERDSLLWMPQAADMIRAGINRPGPSFNIAFTAAGKGTPKSFGTGKPTAAKQIKEDQLRQWFNGLSYAKTVDRPTAVTAALANKPGTLILIFSDVPDSEVEQLKEIVQAQPGLVVHGITIDASNPRSAMHLWLRDREGSESVPISSFDIRQWKSESEAGG